MNELWQQLSGLVVAYVPQILGALALLIIGWLVALLCAGAVRGALRRTGLGEKLAGWMFSEKRAGQIDLPQGAGRGTYYVVMLFVITGVLQILGLTIVTEPINSLLTQLFEYAPKILGAAALLFAAWIVATVLRMLVRRLLGATSLDDRLVKSAEIENGESVSVSRALGDAVYWLVFFLFLPAVLGALSMGGLLGPVQEMTGRALEFLPNLFAAALILLVGWFLARIVRQVVTNLLAAAGADRLGERIGMGALFSGRGLSGVIGTIVYAMIIIPVVISSLGALELDAVTGPASRMLDTIWVALPSIVAALFVLGFSFILGRALSRFLANLLAGIGFDNLAAHLRITKNNEGGFKLSVVAGRLVLAVIMLFAFTEAFELLGFGAAAGLVSDVIGLAGRVLLGLVIFGAGLYLANLMGDTVRAGGSARSGMLSLAVRTAILVLTGAMALRQMGLADEIINLAFGLTLGAFAVASAIAFGFGGREYAAEQIARWRRSIDS